MKKIDWQEEDDAVNTHKQAKFYYGGLYSLKILATTSRVGTYHGLKS